MHVTTPLSLPPPPPLHVDTFFQNKNCVARMPTLLDYFFREKKQSTEI